MKKFYPALMLSAVAMTGLNASAEMPNWEHQGSWQLFEQANQFRPANHTRPIVADFTNNDRFDVYYGSGGDWESEYNKPGLWPWPFLSLMYVADSDGNCSGFSRSTRQELQSCEFCVKIGRRFVGNRRLFLP